MQLLVSHLEIHLCCATHNYAYIRVSNRTCPLILARARVVCVCVVVCMRAPVQSEGVAPPRPSEELASRATKETTVKSWLVMRPTESLSLLHLYRRRVQPSLARVYTGIEATRTRRWARNGFEVNALTGSNDQGPTLGWTGVALMPLLNLRWNGSLYVIAN